MSNENLHLHENDDSDDVDSEEERFDDKIILINKLFLITLDLPLKCLFNEILVIQIIAF